MQLLRYMTMIVLYDSSRSSASLEKLCCMAPACHAVKLCDQSTTHHDLRLGFWRVQLRAQPERDCMLSCFSQPASLITYTKQVSNLEDIKAV